MSALFRQFMIISVVGMTLTLLSLMYFHVRLTDDYLGSHLDSHNKNLSIVLRNSLLAVGLEDALIEHGSKLPEPVRIQIDSTLQRELKWLPVLKIKIYSGDSIVLYSTKTDEIGDDAKHNEGVRSALAGTPISSQVEPDHLNEFDMVVEIDDLHQQYVPILSRTT
ncbi:MAG: hypothetical protein OEU50_21870, partial [Gammaproteobacteria bacterium]|nr:hypothetical protein [Gammaproteobacteria bacterium]